METKGQSINVLTVQILNFIKAMFVTGLSELSEQERNAFQKAECEQQKEELLTTSKVISMPVDLCFKSQARY